MHNEVSFEALNCIIKVINHLRFVGERSKNLVLFLKIPKGKSYQPSE